MAVTLSSSERAPTDIELFADGAARGDADTFEIGDADLDGRGKAILRRIHRPHAALRDWDRWKGRRLSHADYDGFIGGVPDRC